MAMMMVDVPEGRTVHVIVGDVHHIAAPEPTRLVEGSVPSPRRRRPLLMATAGFCAIVVSFTVGHLMGLSHARADQPVASASIPASPPTEPSLAGQGLPPGQGLADQGLPTPPSSDAGLKGSGLAANSGAAGGQVPSAFTQQLKAPPQVVPAPGAPPEGRAPAKNPFGLGG